MANNQQHAQPPITWEKADRHYDKMYRAWENAFLDIVGVVGDPDQVAIIEGLDPKKKKKLITLICRRNTIKIYDETKAQIEAKMTAEAIDFALDEVLKPTLEINDAI